MSLFVSNIEQESEVYMKNEDRLFDGFGCLTKTDIDFFIFFFLLYKLQNFMFGLIEVISPNPTLWFYPSWQKNNCTWVALNPRKKGGCSKTYI